VSFDGFSERFHVPDSTNVKAKRSTLRAQRVRRNARRISTIAEGEQNWRRNEFGTRSGCSYGSYNVS